jgi:hypothetical protein
MNIEYRMSNVEYRTVNGEKRRAGSETSSPPLCTATFDIRHSIFAILPVPLARSLTLALCLVATAATGRTACGQAWARELFDHTSHDFGTVARGAKVQHAFTLENIYEEDVHIAQIKSSCGCTIPKISQRLLKTWEKAQIIAEVDTRAYKGRKDATLTVIFDKPFPAEVRLSVHTYIRSDLVIQPGEVQFGSVTQGTPVTKELSISYAGRSDWRIEGVESTDPHIAAEVVRANGGSGNVNYTLTVTLSADAPPGYIHEHLTLLTNDFNPSSAQVPVPVEGVVVGTVSVRPSPLLLGVVDTGGTAKGRLVVHGRTPFRITAIRANDPRFECVVPTEAKPVHLVPVTFVAGARAGEISARVEVHTDASPEPLAVDVHVRVMPRGPMTF